MHKICFTVSLFHASTCFEHHVLIVGRPKLYYTASGIITPIGDVNFCGIYILWFNIRANYGFFLANLVVLYPVPI